MKHIKETIDVLVGFSVNLEDRVIPLDAPGPFSKVVVDINSTVAGSSLNVARALKYFGSKVHLLYTTGTDSYTAQIADAINEYDIATTALCIRQSTPRTIILSPLLNGNATDLLLCAKPAYIKNWTAVVNKKIVAVQNNFNTKIIVATGVRLIYLPLVELLLSGSGYCVVNPSLELSNSPNDFRALSKKSNLVIVNHEEACAHLDKEPNQFRPEIDVDLLINSLQAKSVIVTWNSHGAFYLDLGGELVRSEINLPIIGNNQALDSVGAGDLFLAAFLVKKLSGSNIQDAMNFAATAAYIKVYCLHPPCGITKPLVEELYKKYN